MKTQLFFVEAGKKNLIPQGTFITPKGFKEMFPNFELLENESDRNHQTMISEKGKREDCFVIFFIKKESKKKMRTLIKKKVTLSMFLTIPLGIVLIFWMIENFPQATGLYCSLLFIGNVMYREKLNNDKNN